MLNVQTSPHPAPYSAAVLAAAPKYLVGCERVLDSMAGTGRIFALREQLPDVAFFAVELQPRWAAHHPDVRVGNALKLAFPDHYFDGYFTSPPYANRMADHHQARDASQRITYQHYHGEPLHADNIGLMQWGPKYRHFMTCVWLEALRVLRPGGVFLLNISDHIRARQVVNVTEWHCHTLTQLGAVEQSREPIKTPRNRRGANHQARVEYEWLICFRKEND